MKSFLKIIFRFTIMIICSISLAILLRGVVITAALMFSDHCEDDYIDLPDEDYIVNDENSIYFSSENFILKMVIYDLNMDMKIEHRLSYNSWTVDDYELILEFPDINDTEYKAFEYKNHKSFYEYTLNDLFYGRESIIVKPTVIYGARRIEFPQQSIDISQYDLEQVIVKPINKVIDLDSCTLTLLDLVQMEEMIYLNVIVEDSTKQFINEYELNLKINGKEYFPEYKDEIKVADPIDYVHRINLKNDKGLGLNAIENMKIELKSYVVSTLKKDFKYEESFEVTYKNKHYSATLDDSDWYDAMILKTSNELPLFPKVAVYGEYGWTLCRYRDEHIVLDSHLISEILNENEIDDYKDLKPFLMRNTKKPKSRHLREYVPLVLENDMQMVLSSKGPYNEMRIDYHNTRERKRLGFVETIKVYPNTVIDCDVE